MNKVLSISIAAYNVEQYLDQVLESLCVETVIEDLDILVISDGSSDHTVAIAKAYEKRYPQSIRVIEKENGGWGSTVNKGMELAVGKYFKLLDGDDWFYSENLEEFISLLKHSETDMVLSAFGMYDDAIQKVYAIKNMPFQQGKQYDFEEVATQCDIQMHGFAVRMDIIRQAKIHIVDHCFYTDTQFVAELFSHVSTMEYYAKPIYCYRIGREGQSVSPTGLLKHMGDNMKVAEELLEYNKTLQLSANIQKAYDNKLNYVITMELYSYCALDKSERQAKLTEVMHFINENNIAYEPSSAEVALNLKTDFCFAGVIHAIFEVGRKLGKVLHVDLIQHVQ